MPLPHTSPTETPAPSSRLYSGGGGQPAAQGIPCASSSPHAPNIQNGVKSQKHSLIFHQEPAGAWSRDWGKPREQRELDVGCCSDKPTQHGRADPVRKGRAANNAADVQSHSLQFF